MNYFWILTFIILIGIVFVLLFELAVLLFILSSIPSFSKKIEVAIMDNPIKIIFSTTAPTSIGI